MVSMSREERRHHSRTSGCTATLWKVMPLYQQNQQGHSCPEEPHKTKNTSRGSATRRIAEDVNTTKPESLGQHRSGQCRAKIGEEPAKSEEGQARLENAKERMGHWLAKEVEGEIAENVKKNEDEKTAENIEGNAGETEVIADEKVSRKSLASQDNR